MKKPLWQQITGFILIQLLLVGILLPGFAFFHHVLPRMRQHNTVVEAVNVMATPTPAPTATPLEEETSAENGEEETEPAVELTEWQQRFAQHFTDEVVWTENSYSSPEVSVTITRHDYGEGSKATVYFVADIYVARIENFRTCLANNTYESYSKANILDMATEHNAIAAVNGDYYSLQYGGVMVRNGQLYRSDNSVYDLCVLFMDGSMETFRPGEYKLDELLARGVWQIWQFGPELLGDNGEADCSYNTGQAVQFINPRTAVGYYEPGHYCFLVADGRQDGYSAGLLLNEMAEIFSQMGCKAAYNLDGGGSAVMCFDGSTVNQQSNGGDREISDLLLIAELPGEE